MKRASEHKQLSALFIFYKVIENNVALSSKVLGFLALLYDALPLGWNFYGDIQKKLIDIWVSFLHPTLPSHSLQQSEREDI